MDIQTKKAQLRRTIEELKKEPQTTMMLSVKTGILRANICRYIAYLEKQNRVVVVKTDRCLITKHRAKFYSCDPARIPKPGQSEMFAPKMPVV